MNKNTFKKIWAFLKTHWYVPLLFLGMLIAFLIHRESSNKLQILFENAREKYQKELDIIEDNQFKKDVEKAVQDKKFKKAVVEIEMKIDSKRKELTKPQKERVKELINEHGQDYDKMADILAKEFNFKVD